jgi:sulfur relay (sulfurtransferase) DsrC/TusE family protein
VILLENFNEWNLSPAKRRILKKKKKRKGLKSKRGETSYEKLHISKGEKKKRMKFASYWERFY